MRFRQLGRSTLKVSVISMGCWALAGDSTWGPQEKSNSIATIHAALDAGINFFDTAEAYGNGYSEEVLGEALAGRRNQVIIASKVSAAHLQPQRLVAACEASLRRLRTDYLDVYYIHWPNHDIPLEDTMLAMERLQQQGKIRVPACSNFGVQDLTELLSTGHRVEANQLPYSLLWRAIEFEIRDLCEQEDIGITCYSPLAQGLLTGKFRSADEVPEGRARTRLFASTRPLARHTEPGAETEVFQTLARIRDICQQHNLDMTQTALVWLTEQAGVASVIVGARTPEQVKQNAMAGNLKLPQEVSTQLSEATAMLRDKLGPNPDMWESESRIR